MDEGQLNWTANFIWILSNPKSARRNGKVQLIHATKWFKPLHKYLGNMRGGS
jgi:type I restriction enzyme M protein